MQITKIHELSLVPEYNQFIKLYNMHSREKVEMGRNDKRREAITKVLEILAEKEKHVLSFSDDIRCWGLAFSPLS